MLRTRHGHGVMHLTVRRGNDVHDGIGCSHRSTLMDQAKRLKFGAIFFTVFWIGGMLWWSGEHHPAYIILLAVCGSIGGYLWFLAMNWMFQHLPPLNGNQGSGRKAP